MEGTVLPFIEDPDFYKKILKKKEFYKSEFSNLQQHQFFIKNYMNMLSKYNTLLLFHSVGTGKTLSAIKIAENFYDTHKIVIFVKNKYIEVNFINEINKFSNPSLLKKITFYTYSKLGSINKLNNSLIIIDEAHNITGNNSYTSLLDILRKSYQTKLLLLTATPMFNNIMPIFDIINIMLSQENLKPIEGEEKRNAITFKKIDGIDEKIPYVLESFKNKLYTYLKGKVSVVSSVFNKKDFPKRNFINKSTPSNNVHALLYCEYMSPLQQEIYIQNISNTGVLYKNLSDISTLVLPDKSFGEESLKKWKNRTGFLKENTLKTYSTKLYSLLKNVKEGNGVHFIYSNYLETGTNIIKNILLENGFVNYTKRSNGKTFIDFSKPMSVQKKKSILSILNSEVNKNGDLIRVIIGSPVVSEGITFKSIRHVHIVEPYWNLSRIEQVIGRGARYLSHNYLEPRESIVNIYLYCSLLKNNTGIDFSKYILSYTKQDSINKVEEWMKSISINNRIIKGKFKKEDTTYELKIHDNEKYEMLKNIIFTILKKGVLFEKEAFTKASKYKKEIIEVLYDIINDQIEFLNINNRPSILHATKEYYIVSPIDKRSTPLLQEQLNDKF
jgi:superfamily II DNA or RNA helicase